MKISDAVLCAECDEVFNSREHTACPSCTNTSFIVLDTILRGPAEDKKENEQVVVKTGDTAICNACGEKISYSGLYWYHTDKHPRHPGKPKEGSINAD